jgi:hypothetical protein
MYRMYLKRYYRHLIWALSTESEIIAPGAVTQMDSHCTVTWWPKWVSDWLRTYGWSGFESQRGLGIFLFTIASRTALEPTQPPIQRVPGALSLGVKRPGREENHSPPSSAEVEECMKLYLYSPNTPWWCGAQLKHRDNFIFTFTSYVRSYKKWQFFQLVSKYR